VKALLDTSFLLFCAEKGRDYLQIIEQKLREPLEPVVLQNVVDELKMLASRKGRRAMFARAALQQLSKFNVVSTQRSDRVDDMLLKYAAEHRIPVLTVDAKLSKRLAASGVGCISVSRSGKPIVRLILR